jgi:hypothetical protein
MGDIVNLRSTPIDLNGDIGHQFVTDCTRAAEGLITDAELAEKYELSPADWQAITKDKALGHAVRAERERRVRSGLAVREAAARALVKGPGILDQIMSGADSHPKHKIDAFKELRHTAIGSSGDGSTADTSEKFTIVINLGADHVEHFETTITPRPPTIEDKADGDE